MRDARSGNTGTICATFSWICSSLFVSVLSHPSHTSLAYSNRGHYNHVMRKKGIRACAKCADLHFMRAQGLIRNLTLYQHETCLYSFDHLKPQFYTVKLGFTGVYINFLISAQKHILWVLIEPPRRGGSKNPTNYVLNRCMKTARIFHLKVSIF